MLREKERETDYKAFILQIFDHLPYVMQQSSTGDTTMIKTEQSSCPHKANILVREDRLQMYK